MKSILIAGLPGEAATKLAVLLDGIRIDAISRLDLVPSRLVEHDYSLLVLSDESAGSELVLAYKQVVSEQLSNRPPIICCLPQTLSKGAPGEWIERPEVGQFTFHPVVCSDLARRIALLLELPLRPPEVTRTLREQTAEALAMLWECFQPAMHDRLNGLEHAILDLRSDSLSGKDRDSAAQQAGTLAGALEPFGFADAACLARDVERVLRAEGEVAPSESDLLCLLVVVLRAELDSATRSPAKAQISR